MGSPSPDVNVHMVELLRFDLDGGRFAVLATVVQEVLQAVAIAFLPGAPNAVEGVINVRGELMPALDIRERLGLQPRPLTADQHIVIARVGPRSVALRVDRVVEFLAIDEAAISSASAVAPGAHLVAGIATLSAGLVVIHDLDRFLTAEEASAVTAALAGADDTVAGHGVP